MVSDRFELDGHVYIRRGMKCNKEICRCKEGQLHGPYWYCDGIRYIGKVLPDEVLRHLSLRVAEAGKLKKIKDERLRVRNQLQAKLSSVEDEIDTVSAIQRGGSLDDRVLRRMKLTRFAVREV